MVTVNSVTNKTWSLGAIKTQRLINVLYYLNGQRIRVNFDPKDSDPKNCVYRKVYYVYNDRGKVSPLLTTDL